jgi:hypothetical protein
MKASLMDELAPIQGVQVKARMYRMLPVKALIRRGPTVRHGRKW